MKSSPPIPDFSVRVPINPILVRRNCTRLATTDNSNKNSKSGNQILEKRLNQSSVKIWKRSAVRLSLNCAIAQKVAMVGLCGSGVGFPSSFGVMCYVTVSLPATKWNAVWTKPSVVNSRFCLVFMEIHRPWRTCWRYRGLVHWAHDGLAFSASGNIIVL